MVEEITKKMWGIPNPDLSLSKFNFHVVGLDHLNPWQGQSQYLRPQDVLMLTQMGYKILATPHIGRLWESNNFYPHMGVVLSDQTSNQSYRDPHDRPEKIFENGEWHHCSLQNSPVLSPYLRLNSEVLANNGFGSPKRYVQCNNLAHVHYVSKVQALGAKNVMLSTELFIGIPWAEDFFGILIENEKRVIEGFQKIGIFDRYLNLDGTLIEANCPGRFSHVEELLTLKQAHHEMIVSDKIIEVGGHYPMNVASILYDCIWSYWMQLQNGAVKGGEFISEVFAVSGMDMINYTKDPGLRACFDRMYKVLLESGKFEWLPKHLRLIFLPGAFFRFLPCNAEEELVHTVQRIICLQEERSNLNKVYGTFQRQLLINKSKGLRQVESEAKACYKESFGRRTGYSQYDILNGKYVPRGIMDALMCMSFEEVRWWFKV
ncbi:MAG: hypothetical protein M3Q34_00875 [bacterium]|nr:hypothetical protein [bacterium]